MRKTILTMALLGAAGVAHASPPPAPIASGPVPPPQLIVAISVDQFSANLFAEYRQRFTDGMKRLASRSAVFPSGYQSHAATETCPGHSTILTGDHPARTGLIANNWFDRAVTRGPDGSHLVYCAEDERVPGSTAAPKDYIVSPLHLKVPTLGDRMKQANPASRVVAVAGKDRAAVMMGGHMTDQIWFLDPKASRSFVTLSDRHGPIPAAVAAASAAVADTLDHPPARVAPAACHDHARATAVPNAGTIGILADDPPAKPGDLTAFRTSPAFDTIVGDLAAKLIGELKLGQGPAPDLIAIGLSATDYVGHAYGTEGEEMCTQMAAVDHAVGRILAALDASGVRYALVLTADHGGDDDVERSKADAYPQAARVDAQLTPERYAAALIAQFRLKADPKTLLLADSPMGDWYLSAEVPAALRPRVLAALRTKLLAHPQVAAVLTAAELRAMPSPRGLAEYWSLAERASASFDPARSGDLVVLLKPYVVAVATPKPGITSTHGSPWDYDRRVPILFYRPGVAGWEQPLPIETVDIMPTLAATIGLKLAKGDVDGRCLAVPGTTCP